MFRHASRHVLLALALAVPGCGTSDPAEVSSQTTDMLGKVPSLVVDVSQTSTSGLSSGAYMAVQLHVAWSSIMKGVGVFAGGPFDCAEGAISNALGRCMSSSAPLDAAPFVARTKRWSQAGLVDPTAALAAQRVFLFSGADDRTVNPAVMDGLRDYYLGVGVDPSALVFERRRPATGHTMPTVDEGVACASTASPYIGACGYDGAGEALEAIYGPLEPRVERAAGTFLELAQADFIASPKSHSLAETAYAYVPAACASGETCRIHVAFHGCQQSVSKIGDAFYKRAGYNEWADGNHLVVLYPQTIATSGSNPNGCWDWWGYDSPDYAKKTGPQIAMVRAMIARLAGGASPVVSGDAGAPPPPRPAEPPAPACVAAPNPSHVTAGRAYVAFGFAYAKGSHQALGLSSPWVRSGLTQVSEGVWARGTCL